MFSACMKALTKGKESAEKSAPKRMIRGDVTSQIGDAAKINGEIA